MNRSKMRHVALLCAPLLALFGLVVLTAPAAHAAGGTTYYIDPNGNDANDCLSTATACQTLEHIVGNWRSGIPAIMHGGDTLILRGGTYSSQGGVFASGGTLSGTAASPTTFKAYPGEHPILSGNFNTVFELYNEDYLTIDGLDLEDLTSKSAGDAIYAVGMSHMVIQNCTFGGDTGPAGSDPTLMVLEINSGRFTNNTVGDNLPADNSDGGHDIYFNGTTNTLISNNTFGAASHGNISFGAGVAFPSTQSANDVVTNNYFHNEYGTALGFAGTGGGMLLENNVVQGLGEQSVTDSKAGLQMPGSYGIVRNNVLYATGAGATTALNFGMVLDGAQGDVLTNAIYNNTVYGAKNMGLYVTQRGENHIYANLLVNNAFYNNDTMESGTYPFDWYFELFHDAADNTWPYFPYNNRFDNNLILDRKADGTDDPGKPNLIYYDKEGWSKSLAQVQTDYPYAFAGNIESSPAFVNPGGGDFHLQAGSPLIDAGADLAHTNEAGTNTTTVHVDDDRFFSDGDGLVPGDTIEIGPNKVVAQITATSHGTGYLTVDRPVSYAVGDAVNLAYNGTAPDIGAYEYGS